MILIDIDDSRMVYNDLLSSISTHQATWPSGYGAGFRFYETYLFERARVRIPQLSVGS